MPVIGIIGLGFVGGAMYRSFNDKIKELNLNSTVISYDKYKDIGNLQACLSADIIFLALPTPYSEVLSAYDCSALNEVISELHKLNFTGLIVIKSTVEPNYTESMQAKYEQMTIMHNPEFLTARTAYEDFHNQKNIVLGIPEIKFGKSLIYEGSSIEKPLCSEDLPYSVQSLISFYKVCYPNAKINLCTSNEAECVKLFCNSFYAVKIQFFNELYMTCQSLNTDYNKVVSIMLDNGWINKMHTQVPGPDGKLSYGGVCFTKDTRALLAYMQNLHQYNTVLKACVQERDIMRDEKS